MNTIHVWLAWCPTVVRHWGWWLNKFEEEWGFSWSLFTTDNISIGICLLWTCRNERCMHETPCGVQSPTPQYGVWWVIYEILLHMSIFICRFWWNCTLLIFLKILQSKFIIGWLKHNNIEIDGHLYKNKYCQQQADGSNDCGVYVLLWCEAYCRNSASFWQEQRTIDIKSYRCRVARTILEDSNSVLRKQWEYVIKHCI